MASLTDYLRSRFPDDPIGPRNSPYEEQGQYQLPPENQSLMEALMHELFVRKPRPPKIEMPSRDYRDDPRDMRNQDDLGRPLRRGPHSSLSPLDIIRMLG